MPKITIDLTDTQAGKVMALNGWKVEALDVIVKRLIVEKLTAPEKPAEPTRPTPNFPHVVGEIQGD